MKIKLKDLQPNPFKKEINGGKLNKEKVVLLKESIEKDGFWDNIICRKVNGTYQIAYGHHRLQAAKEVLGIDYVADIPVKDLSDENMLRILGNENCMQNEEYAIYQVDQVLAVKRFLENHLRPDGGHRPHVRGDQGIGCRQISEFLGEKNWSKSKVAGYLKIHGSLSPKIQHEMVNASDAGGTLRGKEKITVSHAEAIARIPDHKRQEALAKFVKDNELNTRETENLVRNIERKEPLKIERRKIDNDKVDEVTKNFEGQEIVLNCDYLIKLLKKNPLKLFTSKEQAVMVAVENNLIKHLKQHLAGETICVETKRRPALLTKS